MDALGGLVGELTLLLRRFRRNESNHPALPVTSTGDVIVMARLIGIHRGDDNEPNTQETIDDDGELRKH